MNFLPNMIMFFLSMAIVACSFFLSFYLTDSYWISGISAGVLLFLTDKYAFFIVNQLPIFLQKPFYQSYKQRLLAVTKTASPLVAYPMSIFIELTLDKVFKEKGLQAAIEAMRKQVDKMSSGYDFFDQTNNLNSDCSN